VRKGDDLTTFMLPSVWKFWSLNLPETPKATRPVVGLLLLLPPGGYPISVKYIIYIISYHIIYIISYHTYIISYHIIYIISYIYHIISYIIYHIISYISYHIIYHISSYIISYISYIIYHIIISYVVVLVKDNDRWWAVVNTVMKLGFHKRRDNFDELRSR
jgi:hypothetical protein